MQLYEDRYAPNCRRVRVYLAERGLEVPGVSVDIMTAENLAPDYLAINPVGQLPTLRLDDGTCLSESTAICRYFEEAHPDPPRLMGSTPLEKAVIDMWDRRADFEGMKSVGDNFRNRSPVFIDRAIAGQRGVAQIPELIERGRAGMVRYYEMLDRRLGEAPCLAGNSMTYADIAAMCTIDYALFCELEIPADCRHLQSWYEGMEARASAKAWPGMVAQLCTYSAVMGG